MTKQRIYLDYNASAPVSDAVREAVVAAMGMPGNASSVHFEGRDARSLVERSRECVAGLVGAAAEDVIFTSGGTEANNLAISGMLGTGLAARLVVSAVEHASVLDAARNAGVPVSIVPVDDQGTIELEALREALIADPAPALVCVMSANNETGAIQPVAAVAELAHAYGSVVHVDAVQAAGRIPVSMADMAADFISLSAHKIGGPQGVGALVLRGGIPVAPAIRGGGQERGRRSGTENLPGIAGFAAAASTARSRLGNMSGIVALRERLEAAAMEAVPDVRILSRNVPRLANTSCLAAPGSSAETLVIALDLAGIAVSSGSACSSGKVTASHVLAAMGVAPAVAGAAVRVSLGFESTAAEVDAFVAAWSGLVAGRSQEREIAA